MKKSLIFFIIGAFFLAVALGLSFYNIYLDKSAEAQANDVVKELEEILAYKKPTKPNTGDQSSSSGLHEENAPNTPNLNHPTNEHPEGGSTDENISSDISKDPEGEPNLPDYIQFPEMEMPEVTVGNHSYIGTLRIPALKLNLPIMSQWSYKGLKVSPGRYSGSVYSHDLVICGHNYSSCFKNLKNIPLGSKLYFTDMNGNEFSYTAVAHEVLDQYDVNSMLTEGFDMTVFTCATGGVKRETLRCIMDK